MILCTVLRDIDMEIGCRVHRSRIVVLRVKFTIISTFTLGDYGLSNEISKHTSFTICLLYMYRSACTVIR